MQLLFKQRLFSWFDSYDIYNETGETVYTVKGQLAWGHRLQIFDADGNNVGTVQEKILTFLPKFELYAEGNYIGCIRKELTLFRPKYTVDCNGWSMEGDLFEWDYRIMGGCDEPIAVISKQLLNWTDTYVMDVCDPQNALYVLMLVLALDAEKCSDE